MTYNFFPFLFAQEKISLLAPEQEAVKSTLDSLKTARAEALAEKVQNLSNMSADQIISLLLEEAVKIGMKVLAAIAIYVIGAWVIKKIKRIIRKSPYFRNGQKNISFPERTSESESDFSEENQGWKWQNDKLSIGKNRLTCCKRTVIINYMLKK